MPSETLIPHFKPSSSPLNSSKPPPSDHPTVVKSSNWLHRLRSSRGFPESDHIDLEHFLSTSQNNIHHSTDPLFVRKTPPPEHNPVAGKCDGDNGSVQKRDLISNVLSELFYMGECEGELRIKRKKSCRKQPCPRIHLVSSNSGGVRDGTGRKDRVFSRSKFRLTSSSSGQRVKEVNQVRECVEEEKEKVCVDLSAYSQTEVTIIDTSVPCWKSEKVLYRRKNVWKVGDMKGKGLISGDGKKRKDVGNESGGDVPKKKKLKKKLKLCSSSKYADNNEGSMVFSKSDQGHDRGKMVAGNEKKRDNCSQVQEKSLFKKHINEGSSVILIKSIPTTNKKNVSGVSNGCVKSMQR